MKQIKTKGNFLRRAFGILSLGILLSGCTTFSGIRTPKYNGKPFIIDEEKIEAYQNSKEIIGEEKALYMTESFSEDINNPSLEFVNHEPILLEEGTYVVGEDFPAGRVNIYGEAYDPNMDVMTDPNAPPEYGYPDVPEFSVGTITIRDEQEMLYYKNLFHMMYGNLQAQIDFIEGHTIEITGVEPAFVVFYDEEIPETPYIFDPRWDNLLGETEIEVSEVEEVFDGVPVFPKEEIIQPIELQEDGEVVEMVAGIYEAGVHFEPGTYRVTESLAMHQTEFFVFRKGEDPRVFEVSDFFSTSMMGVESKGEEIESVLELQIGDKVYPSYMTHLKLERISE